MEGRVREVSSSQVCSLTVRIGEAPPEKMPEPVHDGRTLFEVRWSYTDENLTRSD